MNENPFFVGPKGRIDLAKDATDWLKIFGEVAKCRESHSAQLDQPTHSIMTKEEEAMAMAIPDRKPTGRKYDDHKPRVDLIPAMMELEVAKVLAVGAEKYSEDNWRQVPNLRARYTAAAKRHINALQQGIMCDEETGLHHAAHAVCCLMFLGEVDLEVN